MIFVWGGTFKHPRITLASFQCFGQLHVHWISQDIDSIPVPDKGNCKTVPDRFNMLQAIWRICLPIWISVPARMENHTVGFIGKTWRSRRIFNNMMELRRGWWKIIVTNSKSSPSPWGNHRLGPQVVNRSDIKPRFWLQVFHLWKKALKGFKRYIQCWFEGQSTQETSATTRTGRTGCVQCTVCVCVWIDGRKDGWIWCSNVMEYSYGMYCREILDFRWCGVM